MGTSHGTCFIISAIGISVSLVIGVVLLVTLLPLSVKQVNHDEYGIHWRKVLHNIDGDLPLGEGRHLLKPDSKLFMYPSKNVLSENTYLCMTKDGVEIEVTITVQFVYDKNEIIDAFNEFGEALNSNSFIEETIIDSVLDACANSTAADFYSKRGIVENLIVNSVGDHLINSKSHVTSGGSTQLKNFKYPDEFGNIIQQIQATEQQIQVLLNQRVQKITEAETNLAREKVIKNTKIQEAEINSNIILFKANQDATAQKFFWNKTADAYELAYNNYKGNGSSTFDDFIQDYLMTSLLSQFDSPVISLTSTS